MTNEKRLPDPSGFLKLAEDAVNYWIDAGQRSVLFMDILRKRGND